MIALSALGSISGYLFGKWLNEAIYSMVSSTFKLDYSQLYSHAGYNSEILMGIIFAAVGASSLLALYSIFSGRSERGYKGKY